MKVKAFLSALALVAPLMTGKVCAQPAVDVRGAWESTTQDLHATMICADKYFSVAVDDLQNKKFVTTYGGSWRLEGDEWVTVLEFHSSSPELIGRELRQKVTVKKGSLILDDPAGKVEWKQLDSGTPGKLAGAWLITGRYRNGQLSERAPGARRTMKILSGTRFQWIAYNVDTKEFSGTGGGTYTTTDGKYVENIAFFSRDNSRVGASLAFDFSLEDGRWRHKGLSSRGEPIDEVWTKREHIGL